MARELRDTQVLQINIDMDSNGQRPRAYRDIQDIFRDSIEFVPALVVSDTRVIYGDNIEAYLVSLRAPEQPVVQERKRIVPRVPRGNQPDDNFTKLSSLNLDTSPVTQEEKSMLQSGMGLGMGTGNSREEKEHIKSSFDRLIEERKSELETVQPMRY
jgi:hypothetical protein